MQQNIEIISDTLCNIFNWDSQNLKLDFINSLVENNIQIPLEVAEKIFDDFVKLEASVRCSPSFDYYEFILARYIS